MDNFDINHHMIVKSMQENTSYYIHTSFTSENQFIILSLTLRWLRVLNSKIAPLNYPLFLLFNKIISIFRSI